MVLPLIIGGIVLASSAIGAGTYFGLKGQAPDVTNNTQYTTQNTTQNTYATKKTMLSIESGATTGDILFNDDLITNQTAKPNLDAVLDATSPIGTTSSLLSSPLVLAGAGAGVAYLLLKKRGKK